MKTLILTLALVLQAAQLPEPKTIGIFYAVSSDQQMTQLERSIPAIKVKSNIFTSSAKGYYQIEGGKASLRFKQGETASFIVQVSRPNLIPANQIRLLSFEASKNKRRILLSEASVAVFRAEATTRPLRGIGFDAERYGENSIKITLNRGLPPGEYGFQSADSGGAVFCFGFDKP